MRALIAALAGPAIAPAPPSAPPPPAARALAPQDVLGPSAQLRPPPPASETEGRDPLRQRRKADGVRLADTLGQGGRRFGEAP